MANPLPLPPDTWRTIEALPAEGEAAPEPPRRRPSAVVALAAVGLVLVLAALVTAGIGESRPGVAFEPGDAGAAASRAAPGSGAPGGPVVAPAATGTWLVDVTGAVRRPGVYRLAPGSRVIDAIDAAGGLGPDVDTAAVDASLNLAAPVADGAKIHVPRRGDAPSIAATTAPGAPAAGGGGAIDLNTASAEQLDTLPGIGPATAAKIIASRSEQPFATVDDLLSRKLVRASVLEQIRALVRIGP